MPFPKILAAHVFPGSTNAHLRLVTSDGSFDLEIDGGTAETLRDRLSLVPGLPLTIRYVSDMSKHRDLPDGCG